MYNKLFLKILDSSIWLEPTPTRITWITLLAAMNEDGYAHFSAIENLASRARVTVEEARAALDCFMAPDPNSGDPDNEGRRVERVPGGFMILNAGKHRETLNRVVALEQNRLRVKRFRERQSGAVIPSGEVEKSPKPKLQLPSIEEVKLAATKIGLSDHEAEKFHAFYESNGWKVGKNTMKSMIGSLAGWKLRNEEKTGPQHGTKAVQTSLSTWELTKIIEAKEQAATGLKNAGSYEDAFGKQWSDEEKRKEYVKLVAEIKVLRRQLREKA